MLTNLKHFQNEYSITVLQFYFKASPFFEKTLYYIYKYIYIYNIR